MINDNLILELFYRNNKGINTKLLDDIKNYPKIYSNEFLNYLNNRFSDSESLWETISRIKLNIEEKPKCKYCHKVPVKFFGKPNNMFQDFCSCSCKAKYDRDKRHISKEAEYGIIHNELMSNRFKRRHIYQTVSDEITPLNSINIKNEKYDNLLINALTTKDKVVTKRIYNGHILEILPNYPNIYNYIINRFADSKSFNESLHRFYALYKKDINCNIEEIETKPKCPICGNPVTFRFQQIRPYNEFCSPKCMNIGTKSNREITNIEKYGVNNPFANKEIKEKIKQTNLRKYGVENPAQSDLIRRKYLSTINNKYNLNINGDNLSAKEFHSEIWKKLIIMDEIQEKSYNTKKKNKSFSVSKPENELHDKLKEIYPNIKRQYKDKIRYPFYCDYYIPELDLFMEYQGFKSHGLHPFDPNNPEDIEILNDLKLKNQRLKERTNKIETLYDRVINGWTITDPLKRQTAKDNNLNYLEIWPDWTFEEILEAIEKFTNKKEE